MQKLDQIKNSVANAIAQSPDKDYIQSASLFGSNLHGDAQETSDVDILIKFRKKLGFFKLFDIKYYLEDKLGREVDLVTERDLSKYFREKVKKEAVNIYNYD